MARQRTDVRPILDPYRVLFFETVRQAVKDCRPARVKADPKRGLDAALFLTTCGPEFCEACGWEVDPGYFEGLLVGRL
jgi:hypothetical protein